MYLFTVMVIVCVGMARSMLVGREPGNDNRCKQFDYDRKLLEKLVRLEEKNKDYTDKIHELEAQMSNLRQDMMSVVNNLGQEVAGAVSKATQHVVTKAAVEPDGWELVFRATAGNNYNVYNAWSKGHYVTTTKPTNMKRSNDRHYLNMNLVNEWETRNIKFVKYALFENQLEVAHVIFDGHGSSQHTWFSDSRLLDSSWPSLQHSDTTFNYFSSVGHPKAKRRFFINLMYGGCPNDQGYTGIIDTGSAEAPLCVWDEQSTLPQFLYSKINGPMIWQRMWYGRADYAAVYIK